MDAGALVGDIEANTVVGARKVGVLQVNAGQPTVVMADDGRTLAVDEVRHLVPNPSLGDLDDCQRIRRHGEEPIERFNHDERQRNAAVPQTEFAHLFPRQVSIGTCRGRRRHEGRFRVAVEKFSRDGTPDTTLRRW